MMLPHLLSARQLARQFSAVVKWMLVKVERPMLSLMYPFVPQNSVVDGEGDGVGVVVDVNVDVDVASVVAGVVVASALVTQSRL